MKGSTMVREIALLANQAVSKEIKMGASTHLKLEKVPLITRQIKILIKITNSSNIKYFSQKLASPRMVLCQNIFE
jgi:hypothetical protein